MDSAPRPDRLCAHCGYVCAADFAFCPRCGTARAATPGVTTPEADRRNVTILFADLTGFTALAEQLDPETVRSFQNALFETLAESIARYDGYTEKFVGDAVLAVFGAPRAHEDDPVRALRAAREMLANVERLSARWMPRLKRTVTLHIGVHTGPVVAGSLGSAANGAYAVTGDTVNTASRLLAAAPPGGVMVSDATASLAQHRFDFGPAEALALRGKAQPLLVHLLGDERTEAQPARGLAELGLAAPLVGRGAVIERLQRAFERSLHGGGSQLILITGEAGSGKSRLLDELLAALERSGSAGRIAVRRVACSSLGEPTYGVFANLFREGYEVDEADSLAVARNKLRQGLLSLGASPDEAQTVMQVLHYVLGIQGEAPSDIEPEQLQRQITLAARALIERRLAHQPLMMVVDDLQWADAASLDLLAALADQLAELPLVLVLAQRPGMRTLRCRRAEETHVALDALEAQETLALVDHLLGPAADASLRAVRGLVAARAGGNPLFVEEIVRSLVGRGLLVRRDGGWACAASCADIDVPPTLYGLLLARVDALAPDERRALQEAAVLGAEFDCGLLQQIAAAPLAMPELLDRLASEGLIRRTEDCWRFTHALLQEVVYDNQLLARRIELHERAGRALEAQRSGDVRGPQTLAELEALGHHWSLSADKARGALYLLAAGDWARAVYANDDAIRHYERALRTLTEVDEPSIPVAEAMLDAHERLGDLLGLTGRRADALAHYDAVMNALDADDEAVTTLSNSPSSGSTTPGPIRAARVLRKIGGLHWEAGQRDQAAACFDAGLLRLGNASAAVERAHLFEEMGRLAFRAGDNTTALSLARRALEEAGGNEGSEADAVRAQASNTLGVALARIGRAEEAVEQIEMSVAQAEKGEMLQVACRGYTNLAVLYASLDPQRSIETCLRGLETARKVGDLAFQSHLYANLAVAYCALTSRCEDEGIEAAHAAASLDRRLGLLDHLAVPLIVLGQIHQCHGDAPRAFESYREALEIAERSGEPQLLFPCYDGLATLYLDAGDAAQAETYLAQAHAVCERAGLEPDALMVLPFLC